MDIKIRCVAVLGIAMLMAAMTVAAHMVLPSSTSLAHHDPGWAPVPVLDAGSEIALQAALRGDGLLIADDHDLNRRLREAAIRARLDDTARLRWEMS